jgi:hypothetical protein
MAKRAMVNPRWLDSMLIVWGRTLPGAKGWYKVCPMLQSGIPSTRPSYEPWDLQPKDFDDLARAIEGLEHKHQCVIRMAYKPWTRDEMLHQLSQYGVTERTHQRWLQDAAAILEGKMAKVNAT